MRFNEAKREIPDEQGTWWELNEFAAGSRNSHSVSSSLRNFNTRPVELHFVL